MLHTVFPARYDLGENSLGVFVFVSLFLLGYEVVFRVILHSGKWETPHLLLYFAVAWPCACVIIIGAIANIYTAQKDHEEVLRRESLDEEYLCLIENSKRDDTTRHDMHDDEQSTYQSRILKKTIEKIQSEDFAPRLFRIPVRPTFFNLVLGYIGASVTALGVDIGIGAE